MYEIREILLHHVLFQVNISAQNVYIRVHAKPREVF